MLGDPCDLLVVGYHAVLDGRDLDIPAVHGPVDERSSGSPAERIAVQVVLALDELALFLQALDDELVGVLDEQSFVILHLGGELAFVVDRADNGDSRALEDIVVILAEAGSRMDDAAAVLRRDIVAQDRDEGALVIEVCKVIEQRLVAHSCKFRALVLLENLVGSLVLVVGRQPALSEDVLVSALLVQDLDVVDFGTQSKSQIRRKSPRSCSPGKEIGVFRAADSETDSDGGICYVFVTAEVDFHVRKRTAETRAVRQDVVSLVDEALVVERLEDPPDAFHEVLVHGLVAVAEIYPASHPADRVLPVACKPEDYGAAFLVVSCNAVLLDLLRAGDAELLLHLVLDGKTVAVPAPVPEDPAALHRLVSRNDVLDCSRNKVAVMRMACGERRSVIE